LYDIFKSKDNNIHVQGFFCPVNQGALGNGLNMAVVKIGKDRILWKRPQESFDSPLKTGHDYYMWMYVNGYKMNYEDVKAPGYTNSFMWAHQLQLDKKHWKWWRKQHNICVGTNDRKLTIKMATPASTIWIPSVVLELAEDEVDYDAKSICSMGNRSGVRQDVDAVSWSESLFSMDELDYMCTACGLMPTVEEGELLQEFSGCNPPGPTPEFNETQFCADANSTADLSDCDQFDDPAWKEACVVEICGVGDGGLDEVLAFGMVDPLTSKSTLLAGRYSVRHHETKRLEDYQIVIACDEHVTRKVTGPYTGPIDEDGDGAPDFFLKMKRGLFVSSYVGYELLQKCELMPSATMIITNSELGLYACLAEVPDTDKTMLAGVFYNVLAGGAKREVREVEYTMEENYQCACSLHCSSCSDASHCVTCSYGYELVDGEEGPQCEKPSIVKQSSGPPQT